MTSHTVDGFPINVVSVSIVHQINGDSKLDDFPQRRFFLI